MAEFSIERDQTSMTTIFFATDVHGSDICWKKFINAAEFYEADILILGGDMTGKAIIPIVHQGGVSYKVDFLDQESILHGEDEIQEMVKKIKSRGYYTYKTTPDEIAELSSTPELVDEIFASEVLKTAEEWLAYADKKLEGTGIRCYVAPGNDDMFELDDLIRTSKRVQLVEGDKLRARYKAMIAQLKNVSTSVFNLHVPPYGLIIDDAPELTEDLRPKYAGSSLVPVGSRAVREIIEEFQPLLGLFGHIHEGKGAVRLGKTLCLNPGSIYEQGRLMGALVKLKRNKVKNYVLTTG
jgi:Icc-related predicted phosphoesterase